MTKFDSLLAEQKVIAEKVEAIIKNPNLSNNNNNNKGFSAEK